MIRLESQWSPQLATYNCPNCLARGSERELQRSKLAKKRATSPSLIVRLLGREGKEGKLEHELS